MFWHPKKGGELQVPPALPYPRCLSSHLDDPDKTKSMVDLAVLVEDDDDEETFTPHKMDSSKSRDTHGSSKWWGSPPAKKVQTKSPVS